MSRLLTRPTLRKFYNNKITGEYVFNDGGSNKQGWQYVTISIKGPDNEEPQQQQDKEEPV